MDAFGLLQTTAQIGVAIAGFGAVASSLAIRAEAGGVEASRFTNMMFASLQTVIGALTPCGLALSSLSEEWVWRISAVVMLVFSITYMALAVRRAKRLGRLPMVTLWLQVILYVGLLTAFLLCAFNVPAGNLAFGYFVGLYLLLVAACMLLFRVAYAMLGSAKPD